MLISLAIMHLTILGRSAPPPIDVEADAKADVDAFIRGDWQEKMAGDAILRGFYEKEVHAFRFGNKK